LEGRVGDNFPFAEGRINHDFPRGT
jgi:hypothetical protein